MIKANELRRGNWIVGAFGALHRVEDIAGDTLPLSYTEAPYQLEDVYPIPLTPEILAKAGFVLDEDLGDMQYYQIKGQKHGYGICFNHDDLEFYKFNSSGITILIHDELYFQYIHQLQNLYFALTGEELEVTL